MIIDRREILKSIMAIPVGVASFGLLPATPVPGKWDSVSSPLIAIGENLRKYWPQYVDNVTICVFPANTSKGWGENLVQAEIFFRKVLNAQVSSSPSCRRGFEEIEAHMFAWKHPFRGQLWGDVVRVSNLHLPTVTADHPVIVEAAYQMGLQMQETEMGADQIDPELRRRFARLEIARMEHERKISSCFPQQNGRLVTTTG